MNFEIKIPYGSTYLELPCEERQIEEFCKKLGIPNIASVQVEVNSVYVNKRATALFADNTYNLDKLNYLAKRLDSFTDKELTTFYAIAYGEKIQNVDALINLTFNTHCASVVQDFSDLQAVGRDMYLTEQIAATERELQMLDGQEYFEQILASNPNPTVTPYGVIYKNSNAYEQVFDGVHFPEYMWKDNLGVVTLGKGGCNEYLYLPFAESELSKALERLGADSIHQCSIEIDSEYLNDTIIGCILQGENLGDKLIPLSEFSNKYVAIGTNERKHIDTLVHALTPQSPKELNALMDSLYEFEIFPNIRTPEEYGRYMIVDSGHFEYDENLEDFIDFRGYGNQRLAQESGVFLDGNYVVYHGYNMELSNMLNKIGIDIGPCQNETLRLYMPLKGTTYYDENDYGDLYQTDYEMDIGSDELAHYEDDIAQAVENNSLPEEQERGLMRYYGKADSVNAKVKSFHFEVENIKGKLMGVAVLELNASLNDKELEKIKDEISGQASDGWGEGFEQREIKLDDGKEIYVNFWQSKNWSLQTAEELGFAEPKHELSMGGMTI